MRRPNATPVAILVGLSISVLLAGFTFDRGVPPTQTFRGSRCGVASGSELWTLNATPDLPPSFANGSVQAFGVNSSDVVVGGVSFFSRDRTPYDSLPALGSFTPSSPGSRDLTNTTGRYFDEGGVFPVAWNGTAWLIAGQTTLDGQTFGAAIAVQGGKVTDLTPKVAPFFQGQGIWIAGWDGNGWLLGGNDTRGAVLVYLKGGTVTNLTPVLPNNSPGDWVQMVAWNGTAWLIGGERVFGSLEDGRYTDLLPASPFAKGAVFAMGWNGTTWLTGGSPETLAWVVGDRVSAGPQVSDGRAGWVNSILALPRGGWLVAGGSYVGSGYSPFLGSVPLSERVGPVANQSACLPGAFDGGWVQYGGAAPPFGDGTYLLVGEGGVRPSTLASHSAAVAIAVGA